MTVLPQGPPVYGVPPSYYQPYAQPPAGPPPPSAKWYWLGGGIIAAGVVGAITWFALAFVGLMHQVDGFPRATIPGGVTVFVDDPGTRVLYYEGTGATPSLASLGVRVSGPDGAAVSVTAYSNTVRYDVPDRSGEVGHAIGSFHASAVGSYVVTVRGTGTVGGVLAVGDDVIWDIVPSVLGAAGLGFISIAVGVAIIVVTATRRSRARQPMPRFIPPPRF